LESSRPKPVTRRRELALFAVPMVLLAIGTYVGNGFAPTLVNEEPGLLLALAPRLRWLLLASPNLDALPFYGIPMLRAAAVLSLWYLFGLRYGDTALQWMEDRTSRRTMRPLRWIERQFHRARFAAVVLFPAPVVALLSGADTMRYAAFLPVALASTAVRLFLVRTVADALEDTLVPILDWISDNQIWLTVLSIGGVFVYALWTNRDSTSPIESVEGMAEQLDEAAAEVAEEHDPDPA
jgi:membrane protein DedA with SNARE-associated domain